MYTDGRRRTAVASWLVAASSWVALVGASAVATEGTSMGAVAGLNVNVTADSTRVHVEPFIAADPTDRQRLVAASNQINATALAIFLSEDGGLTWRTTAMPLGAAIFHTDPGVAFDSRGFAYVSALGNRFPIAGEIQVVRSTDGGRSWPTAPEVVYSSAFFLDRPLVAANRLASGCRDYVCVAWRETDSSLDNAKVSCAIGGTTPWLPPVLIAQAPSLNGVTPAFGPQGELHVAWNHISGGSIDYRRANTCSMFNAAPTTISGTRGGSGLYIPAICDRQASIYPALDVDRSPGPYRGQVYVAWTDSAPGSVCSSNKPSPCDTSVRCDANVYFAFSKNNGVTWSAPRTVHDLLPGTDQFNPWLAVGDLDGSVNVTWYDTRNDPARLRADVYFRRSLDGGATWGPELKVTSAPSDETNTTTAPLDQYGDYAGLAVAGCVAHPIWIDRRAGGAEQVYTASISAQAPLASAIDNSLLGASNPRRDPSFTWKVATAGAGDYRIFRGTEKDFTATPPVLLGTSGGANALAYTDGTSPSAPGCAFYQIEPVGTCP